jgi:hypothetical protein
MATSKNLRYCQVLHDGTYYDVIIAVDDLDQVNDILQEWALANDDIGEALDLPSALIINTEAKDINLISKDIDAYVYIKSAVSSYMDFPRFAGISGDFPTLPKVLAGGYYVMPEVTAFLYSQTDFDGVFGEYTVDSLALTLIEDEVNFIGITYNSGSPVFCQV